VSAPPFGNVVSDLEALGELYRPAHDLVLRKDVGRLDEHCRAFIATSPFVLVATTASSGTADVSPRGGPPGFVQVLDEHRLAIPDLNGNNRLDTIRNVVDHGAVGLLFVIPGLGESLRVNGRAWVTTDDAVLDGFTHELRRPTAAIGVQVEEAFLHCAKAFRRSGLWDPATWPSAAERPSPSEAFKAHLGLDVDAAVIEADLEEGYAHDLRQDQPDPV
jgi:PPOX class probable FMN-dependent enzyme